MAPFPLLSENATESQNSNIQFIVSPEAGKIHELGENQVAHAVLNGDLPIKPGDCVFNTLPHVRQLLLDCWNRDPENCPPMAEVLLRL